MASFCIKLGDGSEVEGILSVARDVLLRGGVIVAPTETVYGLMTLWGNATGREAIYRLKARPEEKRLQMLAHDIPQAGACGVIRTPVLDAVAEAFWPGPLTAVVDAEGGDTIGLRIPSHAFILQLLRGLPEPLAATSANRSSMPPATNIEAALNDLAGEVDLGVDGGEIATGDGVASTVISLIGGDVKLLREGPISIDVIAKEVQRTVSS